MDTFGGKQFFQGKDFKPKKKRDDWFVGIPPGFDTKPPPLRKRLRALERGATVEMTGIGLGPGPPPEGFVGGTTSVSEWYVYWALTKLLGPEGIRWTYQESFLGGRYVPGGSVADFVAYTEVGQVILRVQTFYFHLAANSEKQQYDIRQRVGTIGAYGGELNVIDLYEQEFIHDRTGLAVLRLVNDALAGIQRPNPIVTGRVADIK